MKHVSKAAVVGLFIFLAPPPLTAMSSARDTEPPPLTAMSSARDTEPPVSERRARTEMIEIWGEDYFECGFGCRIFCTMMGITAGMLTGNPGVALLVGVGCAELINPEKLG